MMILLPLMCMYVCGVVWWPLVQIGGQRHTAVYMKKKTPVKSDNNCDVFLNLLFSVGSVDAYCLNCA